METARTACDNCGVVQETELERVGRKGPIRPALVATGECSVCGQPLSLHQKDRLGSL